MAEAHRRHDRYGRPLPTLVTPQSHRAPISAETEGNRLMRAYIADLLDATFASVLHPGVRAEIRLTLIVKDGRLQPSVDCDVKHQYRVEQPRKER